MNPPTPFTRRPQVVIERPRQARPTDPDDPRLADRIRPDDGSAADVALLGAPFDGGVTAGGGRAGAALGPAAVRRALLRAGTTYHLEHDLCLEPLAIVDAGDLEASPDTRETHQRLETALAALLARGVLPVVIGGGHDLTFATLAALARRDGGPVGAVSLDAHLDVRPVRDGTITSGTPFRRALEEGLLDGARFTVLGPHGNRNARAHLDWLRTRGGRVVSLAEARRLGTETAMTAALARATGPFPVPARLHGQPRPAVLVSLDIDSAAQAHAPGCSAPSPDGFRPDELLAFAFLAGADPSVAAFDVMEVNPRYDLDNRTAALAAAAIVQFLFGVAKRRTSGLRHEDKAPAGDRPPPG